MRRRTALATLIGSALAAPYGYNGYSSYSYSYGYPQPGYSQPYGYANRIVAQRDSDRDGIPDRAEWNQDRDRDGRLDQYDSRFDRRDYRRDRRWGDDHRRYVPYQRYDSYDRYYR